MPTHGKHRCPSAKLATSCHRQAAQMLKIVGLTAGRDTTIHYESFMPFGSWNSFLHAYAVALFGQAQALKLRKVCVTCCADQQCTALVCLGALEKESTYDSFLGYMIMITLTKLCMTAGFR